MSYIRALFAPNDEQGWDSCEDNGEKEEGDDLGRTGRVRAKGVSDFGESAVADWWLGRSHRFGRIEFDGKIEDMCG